MKKLLSTLVVVVFSLIVFSACTEENVQPSGERVTSGAITIRD